MKKAFFLIAAFSIISVIMLSCESNLLNDVNTISPTQTKSSLVSPSNSLNVYDYIGQRHNDSLYVLVTTSDTAIINNQYIYNRYYESSTSLTLLQIESILSQLDTNPKDYSGYMKTFYENNQDVVPALNAVLCIINNDSSLQQKVNLVTNYENSFNYNGYNSNQIVALKAMFSVARHSMVLWSSEEEGGIDLSNKGKQLKVNYIGGNPRTHAIVVADIWGALGGALTGGPGSALVGAIWGSGIEWISD